MSSNEKSKVVKDEIELKCVKTSSSITNAIVKKVLLPKIETIIDEGDSVEHKKISDEIMQFYLDPKKMSSRLDPSVVDAAFNPVIQSGGVYDLDNYTISPGNLHFGCIIIQVGSKYKNFCTTTARTYLIDPPDIVRKHYSFLYDLHRKLTDLLYPGTEMNHIYNTAIELINDKYPKLIDFFIKDCGSSIGADMSDAEYTFNKECTNKLQKGMVVTLKVGFNNLELPENLSKGDEKNKVYSLLICDTIIITDDGPNILTDIKKKASEICYSIEEGEEDEEEEEEEEDKQNKENVDKNIPEERVFRVTRSRLEKDDDATKNAIAKRKEHQKELARRQQLEAQKRFSKNVQNTQQEEKSGSLKEYIAYKSPSELPRESSRNKIFIDRDKEALLLPIYGYLVPFHITTVKSVSKSEDFLRIIFKTPITGTVNDQFSNPKAIFIKEVTYRVPSSNQLNENYRLINELKKRVTDRESKKSVMESLTVQESLIKSTRPGPKLTNLKIRPTLGGGRKTVGTLEAHQNGFRYITTKKGVVDIIYRNIKHAFFQPSEKVEIVLVHFHLHNAIMIGKKKTFDVQFYTEVYESSQTYGNTHTSWGDADEIEEEQRRRMLKNKLNLQFKTFVKQVEDFTQTLEFDIPYKELGFYGALSAGNVFLQPTVHCLVQLTDSPFFVVTLDEVEIAFFERVQFSLRQFDIAIVYKDWSKPTTHIRAVPIDSLDTIKEWLDSCDIKYYESAFNLNWKKIMQIARENPKKFWEDGGWSILGSDDSDEEEDMVEEEEDDFVPSGSESDDFEVSESESRSDDASFDEEEDDISMEESEEEGMDWDEHEELAKKEDLKHMKRKRDEEGNPGIKKRKY